MPAHVCVGVIVCCACLRLIGWGCACFFVAVTRPSLGSLGFLGGGVHHRSGPIDLFVGWWGWVGGVCDKL
jgi:hypothetical protein